MVSTVRTAALAGAMAFGLLGAPTANAAFNAFLFIQAPSSTATYDFSGVLTNGNDAVSGKFTLDNSGAGAVTAFDFKDAAGHFEFDTSNASGLVFTDAATSPNATFVGLTFNDGGDLLTLLFETTLPAFDGSTFFTGPITTAGGGNQSRVNCFGGPACPGQPFISVFVSGAATPAVPEPASLSVLALGLAGLGMVRRARRV